MKKLIFLLMIVLFIVSGASANRIMPTNRIGLFIDPDSFIAAVWNSRLDSYVTGIDSGETSVGIFHSYYLTFYLKNDVIMTCIIDDVYGKIGGISLSFPAPMYSKSSPEIYTILGLVLKCSGLLFSEYDDALTTARVKGRYVNDSYGISIIEAGRYDTEEIDVSIYDSYWFTNWEETPYSRIKKYYGQCDPNYVGACVPLTNGNLDCKHIGVRNFFVIGQDKHYFDGDGNGVCCEPYPNF